MKICKKITAFMLMTVVAASMMVGCGKQANNNQSGDREVIEVKLWRSGMGEEWMKSMIAAFEEDYPEYKVNYMAYADSASVMAGYGQEDIDTTDLYFSIGYDDSNANLDDLLDSTAEGESKTIREKFGDSFISTLKSRDGSVRHLTYGGGVIGIVYNKKLFDDAGIKELPRTTNELVLVCDTLSRNKITPWCHFKQGGYWDFMLDVFAMQYDGFEYRNNVFYACTDEQGNSPSKDVLTRKDGRYETLKMLEAILTPDYVLSGSNSADHITIQTRFIHEQAAMMVNGSWMSNEMESVGTTDNFGVMKTPVLSSIVDKLSTVKKDSELSAVVEAIDLITDGKKTEEDYRSGDGYVVGDLKISADDWKIIDNARNTVGSNYGGCTVYIPGYSEQTEGAKEFLRYIYSDKGLKIYAEETGTTLPLETDSDEIDISKWNSFQKGNLELRLSAKQFATSYIISKHPIFDDGGVITQLANQFYVQYLTALNASDLKSADELWNEIMDYIDSNYESVWLKNIQ